VFLLAPSPIAQFVHGMAPVEIRKLLHEISRIAEQSLEQARKVKEEVEPAVRAALDRLDGLEREAATLAA
jgi:BMFP domain-containing protein YqiC